VTAKGHDDRDADRYPRRQPSTRQDMFSRLPELSTDEGELDFRRRGIAPPVSTTQPLQLPERNTFDFSKRGLLPPAIEKKQSPSEGLDSRPLPGNNRPAESRQHSRFAPLDAENHSFPRTERFPAGERTFDASPSEADFSRRGVLPPATTAIATRATTDGRKPFSQTTSDQAPVAEEVPIDFSRRGVRPPGAETGHSAATEASTRKRHQSFLKTASKEEAALDFGRRGIRPPAATTRTTAKAVESAQQNTTTDQGSKTFAGKEAKLDWSQVRRGVRVSKDSELSQAVADDQDNPATTERLSTTANS
jgi:hypothetical protein